MKPSTAISEISKLLSNFKPVLLSGPPAIGKTSIIKQIGEKLNRKVIISHPVVSDPTDYKGMPFIINGEAKFMPFNDLKILIDTQEPIIFLLDDLGHAPHSVQAAAMQLLLERRINGYHVSDLVTFVAATNRRKDKAGVNSIIEPLKSRFCTIIEIEADLDDWVKWATEHDIVEEVIYFIKWMPEFLCDFQPTSELTNSSMPRTLEHLSDAFKCGISPEAELQIFSGTVGEQAATSFIGFLEIWRSLTKRFIIHQIISNPMGMEIPGEDETSVKYAICGKLSQLCDKDNFDSIIKYSKRLGAEYSVMLVKNCVTKDPSLKETETFVTWAINNQDMLI